MKRRELLKTLAGGVATWGVAATTDAAPTGSEASAPNAPRPGDPLRRDNVSFWSETSLRRIYPTSEPGSATPLPLLTPRNAQLSFQVAARNLKDCGIRIRARVTAPEGWDVRVRRVGFVPMPQHDTDTPLDEIEGIGHVPGLVPDPLFPDDSIQLGPAGTGAFWITLRIPESARVEVASLSVQLTVEDEFRFPAWTSATPWSVELPVSVDVRPLALRPRTDFPATQWISADSIWEYYRTEPFSERFWQLADAYIANMTAHNFNVIYCPIFNARHEILERPAQLLKVKRTGEDQYEFDFTDVRRWIALAKKHGADHLEWTHFFTPAPTSGRYPQRIFERSNNGIGKLLWAPEISATSTTYRRFLEQFLPAFETVLREENVLDRSLFHCADEPDGAVQIADYRKARALLRELAPWMKVIDAMSDPHFASEKLSDMPVPSIATAHAFTAAGCPAWVYFCCGPRGRYLQRLFDTPLTKLRMAGWLFYKLRARGFLHWGHNYWFVFCTGTIANPFADATNGAWPGMPHGDTFVVYPGADGPIDSIRWEVLAESLQDYAMLQSAGVAPDDPLFADLKSYEDYPKQEAWLASTARTILNRTPPADS
ncbi:hypothetical protein Pan44_27800 [Caulifigura coniformis]|uniref:Glycoside hydrolase 123 catalytic domain-containing protein n=1 Tax=Caulifigura coniformis TaxID=2527983 RepID=A0A517SF29_9PLAN|nr:DUF4091 domain-containing protein [Caulifigura coniformis]QDT54744.1 hypothetical protein Pan44_27800 [Caulifigura coniformis]